MIEALMVLNAGSSSIKFQILRRDGLDVLAAGRVTRIGGAARLEARLTGGSEEALDLKPGADHEAALAAINAFLARHAGNWRMVATVHRVVHGGADYVAPVIVTPAILAELAALTPLAPLHQPHNLAAIAASARLAGDIPDIACFDTAFHAGRSELFYSFAVSRALREQGVRRYGFHGLSYQWIAHELRENHPALHAGRVVVAHLGNGASLCAMRGGVSVDTTMGLTALDGLPMGTRPGSIDPGAVLFMLRHLGMSVDEVEAELYHRSGLKGLSGISNDVETLLQSDEPRAAFALDYFALRTAQQIAAMAASLAGIDALVFTGGVGENAAPVRAAILSRLGFLGDFATLVIPANEERMMGMLALQLLDGSQNNAS
jgi:acetate kinase